MLSLPARVKYEEKKKAISLVKRGYSYTKAAEEVGVNSSTVHRWCTSAGVKSSFRFQGGAPRKIRLGPKSAGFLSSPAS